MWRQTVLFSNHDLSVLNFMFAWKKNWTSSDILLLSMWGESRPSVQNFILLFTYNTFNPENSFETSNTTKRNRSWVRFFELFRYQLHLKVSPSSFKWSTGFCCYFDHNKRQVWYLNPVVWIFISVYNLSTFFITSGSGCLLNFLMLRCFGLFYYGKDHETSYELFLLTKHKLQHSYCKSEFLQPVNVSGYFQGHKLSSGKSE